MSGVISKGFDVSAWQEDGNGRPLFTCERMKQAKEEGADFVIIKLGENFTVDEHFQENITNALEAGLAVGVYYFSRAYDTYTAGLEAAFVDDVLSMYGYTNWHLKMGVWMDFEEHTALREKINNGGVTAQEMTDIIRKFVYSLKSKGRERVGVYGGFSLLWEETFLYSQCSDIPVWVAQYGRDCDYPNAKIWQYTDGENVAGVAVDGNYLLEDFEE